MKRKIIRSVEIVSFIFLLLFCSDRISMAKLAYCYEDNPGRSVRLYFEMPRNTVDVVFLGDSHAFCGVIPQYMFDDEGISAVSLATPTQFIKNTYWLLKDAVKTQDIKIAVIDVHSLEHSIRNGLWTSQYTSGLLMMSDYSLNKLRGFFDTKDTDFDICSEMTVDMVYPLMQFNSDFGRENGSFGKLIDFMIHPGNYFKTFGYNPQMGVIPIEKLSSGIKDDFTMYGSFIEEYMEKIYALCEENDVELVLTRLPFFSDEAHIGVYEDFFKWAKEKDVKVIDFFEDLDASGIDLSTDFRDDTHLNYSGAKRATAYFGRYLKENFDLEDHRGDARYSLWENNDYDYTEIEKQMEENIRLSKQQ